MADLVRFQHYEVLRREDGSLHELGRGAMGITYKAFDTNLRTPVALKVINANYLNSDVARQRFLREARAAAAIRHPNVATVFHLGHEEDAYFYAMEFIDGETVEAYMQREGAVPTLIALEIAAQVARALAAAEKQGLVHRDIKPSNLMLVHDDGELTVKVIDFGLAKAADKEAGDTATLTMGGFLGTPHFASPEQLEERELDTRSDIYSLGVTLYYMLAGRTPFSGSLAQVMSQHLHREPPLELLASQPPQVIGLLERMMEKDAAARPQSPAELRREIEACIDTVQATHSGSAGGAPAETTDAETITDAPREPSALIPAPGVRIADRLELLEEYKPGEHGKTFRAKDHESGEIVAVLILDPGLLPTSQAYTRLENEVTAIQAVKHPAVIRVHGLERAHHITFLTREWIEGPSLLDAMRQRGGIPTAGALEILASIAGGLDAVQRTGVPCPELAASWITLTKDAGGATLPKFNALSFSAVAPLDPDATLVSAPLARGAAASDRYIAGIAALAYQMLGGMHAGHETFVPIPGISEEANLTLRRALKPDAPFVTPGAFVAALTQALGNTPAPAAAVTPPPLPTLVPEMPRKAPSPALIFTIVALALIVALLAGIAWIAIPRLQVALQAGKHSPTPAPTATPSPTPLVTEATPTPTATPSAFDTALERVKELGLAGNYLAALGTLDDLARDNPAEAVRLRDETEKIAAKLRAETPNDLLAPGQLTQLAEVLDSASQRGSTSAQMLLGKSYLADQPAKAFTYFYLAATDGQNNEAMYQVGDLYAAGRGTDKDLAKAVEWFQKSANFFYPPAIYALGECYFFGKGVPQDYAQSFRYLQLAANYDNRYAQNLLGDLYRKGLVGRPNYVEAFRLWTRASQQGLLDSQAKLGVMYWMGEIIDGKPVTGTPDRDKADVKTAFQLWKDGAAAGNTTCMFYYAKCLLNGIPGVLEPDEKAGRAQMIVAAEHGNPQAQEWCRDNDVKFQFDPR